MTPFEYESAGFYIGGQIVPASDPARETLISPATTEPFADVPVPAPEDADGAVAAARATFDSGLWRDVPVAERAQVVRRACDEVEKRVDEIATLAALEIGAPVQVTGMFVNMVVRVVRAMSDLAQIMPDRVTETGLWEYEIQYDPIGVVVDVVPWNGPFSATMMKSAQALLAGCTVVSKPPPSAPFAVSIWADALAGAGLPPGAFSFLPAGAAVSEYLVSHRDVDLVVFTGGTSVGQRVAEMCGRNLTRVVLELGGKSAAVVMEDADLQLVADSVAAGVYFNSGQICSALSRVVAPRSAVDGLVDLLRSKASEIVIGNPLDSSTTMGPLATARHHERVLRCIEEGRTEGATLAFGGKVPADLENGWFVEPTLFVGTNSLKIAREEIFGPVVTVIPHDGEDDAIAIANDSDFGLGGSVFSADEQRAIRVASQVKSGSVTINGYTTNLLAPRDPFKTSGMGTVTGTKGFRTFQSSRTVNLRAAQGAWNPSQIFVRS
jgi:aldehyde dehydrogenase (NAD+)